MERNSRGYGNNRTRGSVRIGSVRNSSMVAAAVAMVVALVFGPLAVVTVAWRGMLQGVPGGVVRSGNAAVPAMVGAAGATSGPESTSQAESGERSHFDANPQRISISQSPSDVVFSPDGKRLYVTDTKHTLHILDAKTGKEQHTISDVEYAVTDDSGKRLFLASAAAKSGTVIKVVDSASFKQVSTANIGHVSSWQITHDGTRIITTEDEYSGSDYGDKSPIHIYDVASGKQSKTFDVTHEMHPPTVVSSKDGKSYIVAGTDGKVQRVDAKTFKVTDTATIDTSGSDSFAPVLRPDDDHGDVVYVYDWGGPGLQRVHLDSGDVDAVDTDGAGLMFISTYGKTWFATLKKDDMLSIAPLTGTGRNDTPKLGEPVEFAPDKGIMPRGSMDGSTLYYEIAESGKTPSLYVYDVANRQMLEPLHLPKIPDGSGSGGNAAPSWDGSRFAVPDGDGRQVLIYDLVRKTPIGVDDDTAGDVKAAGPSETAQPSAGSQDSSAWYMRPWVWIIAVALVLAIAIITLVVVLVARSRAKRRACGAAGAAAVPGMPAAPGMLTVPGMPGPAQPMWQARPDVQPVSIPQPVPSMQPVPRVPQVHGTVQSPVPLPQRVAPNAGTAYPAQGPSMQVPSRPAAPARMPGAYAAPVASPSAASSTVPSAAPSVAGRQANVAQAPSESGRCPWCGGMLDNAFASRFCPNCGRQVR